MKSLSETSRTAIRLLLVLMITAGLAACGGGGGTSSSSGTSGAASVNVSIASATAFPAGATLASSSVSSDIAAAPGNSPAFDNVFVTVTRLALIPADHTQFPDHNGELETMNSHAEEGRSSEFVTVELAEPVVIDLLHPPTGGEMAGNVLNRFSSVPAGEYSKIRMYYDNVVGRAAGAPDVLFHPTAHYHFDVHFVGGKLVIPASSDPQGGIRFYSVVINVVGLKYHQAGGSGNVLLRPQVFAEVVGAPNYIVTGVADQVDRANGTFVVKTASDNVGVDYGSGTLWYYYDGRYVGSLASLGISGPDALRDTALVHVIGTFLGGVLVAEKVGITFPAELTGVVDGGWKADNTFDLRLASDNAVFPIPDRSLAYYDNAAFPHARLTDAAIDNNIQVKARGYAVAGGIEAFWISVVE